MCALLAMLALGQPLSLVFSLRVPTENIHRIHRRQHVSEDDAGISKHRLSPYNAYYHN